MQSITVDQFRSLAMSNDPKIFLWKTVKHGGHDVDNNFALGYIQTKDGEFVYIARHYDINNELPDDHPITLNNCFTHNLKALYHLGFNIHHSYDILYDQKLAPPSELMQFYQSKLGNRENVSNHIIPMYKHLEDFENMTSELDLEELVERRGRQYGMYNDIYNTLFPRVFYEIEKQGLGVDKEEFVLHYGKDKERLVRDSRVYTEYNLYTTTGRPSNSFGGVNYAAINKSDGSRHSFITRFGEEGLLINIDFNSYHLHLIAKVLDIGLPDDPHTMLGKEYFNTDKLTAEQYDESKKITFTNLYNTHLDGRVKDIGFFKSVENFKKVLWKSYVEDGVVYTPAGRAYHYNEEMTDNKLFNYYMQSLETEESAKEIYTIYQLTGLWPVLYTYDSMLYDVPDSFSCEKFVKDLTSHDVAEVSYPFTGHCGYTLGAVS